MKTKTATRTKKKKSCISILLKRQDGRRGGQDENPKWVDKDKWTYGRPPCWVCWQKFVRSFLLASLVCFIRWFSPDLTHPWHHSRGVKQDVGLTHSTIISAFASLSCALALAYRKKEQDCWRCGKWSGQMDAHKIHPIPGPCKTDRKKQWYYTLDRQKIPPLKYFSFNPSNQRIYSV